MIDSFCHALYFMLTVSMILVGRKKSAGWLLYIVASLGWIWIGIELELTSMIAWSSLYALTGIYNWIKWKNVRT